MADVPQLLQLSDGSVVKVDVVKRIACPGCNARQQTGPVRGVCSIFRLSGGQPGEFPPGFAVITHSVPQCDYFKHTSADVEMWRGIFEVTHAIKA